MGENEIIRITDSNIVSILNSWKNGLDAGKHIYGTVKEINNDDSYMNRVVRKLQFLNTNEVCNFLIKIAFL